MRTISLPPLHDSHSHVSLYAALDSVPDISALDASGALELLGSLPEGRLNLVRGWKSDKLAFTPDLLESLPPVLVINFSLHGFVLTESALPFAEELWPEFVAHRTDEVWTEANLPEIFTFYGRIAGLDEKKLGAFMERLAVLGLCAASDMSTTGEEALETIAHSPYAASTESWASPKCYAKLCPRDRARVRGFKLFADGSLGARNAAIEPRFLGGEPGMLLYSEDGLETLISELAPEAKALAIHAIGHRAIGQVLLVLERCMKNGLSFPLVRLEHVQFINKSQAVRARDMGIRLSMQPNFSSDSIDYADRLPPTLRAENNPFRMLIDEVSYKPGKDLVFGSDGMPHGAESALRWSLFPPVPGQVLDLAELIAGYGSSTAETAGLRFSVDDEAHIIKRLPGGED